MARSASRERILCSTCDLPFYADRGSCPYCEADGGGTEGSDGGTSDDSGFVFGNDGPEHRARRTCPECGLDHYEDADACPYCSYADAAREARSSEAGSTQPTVGDDGGLFGRLKRALGL